MEPGPSMWDVVRRKIRRLDAVPLVMLRSQSFSADKGNQKPGIGGKRVMHTAERRKLTGQIWLMEGSHRSSECALAVAQESQWRVNELGLLCVLSNFDGTNAFGATMRDLLISTAQKTAKENDKMFSLGPRAARDAEEFAGRDCAPNVERNQREQNKKCPPFLGSIAGC